MALEQRKLNNKEKAAIMLLCLDEAAVADVFGQMRDEEVREINRTIQSISNVPIDEVHGAMMEFYQQLAVAQGESSGSVMFDGSRAAERLVTRALPYDRSQVLFGHSEETYEDPDTVASTVNSFEAKTLFEIIKEEHPQLIAIIISMAKVKLAKEFLALLSPEIKSDVVARLAKLQEVPEALMGQIKDYLDSSRKEAVHDSGKRERKIEISGIDKAIKMLKSIAPDESVRIIDGITSYDEQLGWSIEKQMLTMEDIVRADAAGVRELLRSITTDDLKVALKDMTQAVQEKFYQNMSSRAATILREDIEILPAQKVEDVERGQKDILSEVKRLITEGKLKLASLEDE